MDYVGKGRLVPKVNGAPEAEDGVMPRSLDFPDALQGRGRQ